eukprot:scaffold95793_cov59-Phaeocystis_antarctica.AAC.1
MRLPESCQQDDQLVGPTAIRRDAGHLVAGALELIAVADEGLALRRLRDTREGRREGNQGGENEEPHAIDEV